ncbi:glycosyltransferase [Wenzhouxiangella sp. EGI_FJ10305]|uniref:glycosyltransferase n=1 Tax=Wenzhouxiangella sp. EGI_FJ10305 TaxID=3243768 RepID=UPI0035E31C14
MRYAITHLRSSSGLYGAEQMVLELCRQQAAHYPKTRLLVFAPVGRDPPDLLLEGQSRQLPVSALPCRGPFDPACVLDLRRRLRADTESNQAVLHCHDYKSVVYGGLASAGIPVTRIATLHGWLDDRRRLRLYHWLEARMLQGFQRVCAVSPAIAERLSEQGLDPALICRVNNGIDVARFRPRRNSHAGPGRLLLGTAARLSPEKNLKMLIRVVAACRDQGHVFNLEIMGEGPQRAELEALVRQLGLEEQVRLPGSMNGLEHWYPRLDAFVLPSLKEGMPLTVLESLACGCPVIASATGAIPELLDGIPGCQTVPPGDEAGLTEALLKLPAAGLPLMAAHRRVSRHYSGAHMATRYSGIYRSAVNG